jgi:hypothetical protein
MDYRLSIRIDESSRRKLSERSRLERKKESVIVREALEAHLSKTESLHDRLTRIGGLGIAKGTPGDLSTNKKHMEGFGTNDSAGSPRRRPSRRTSRS